MKNSIKHLFMCLFVILSFLRSIYSNPFPVFYLVVYILLLQEFFIYPSLMSCVGYIFQIFPYSLWLIFSFSWQWFFLNQKFSVFKKSYQSFLLFTLFLIICCLTQICNLRFTHIPCSRSCIVLTFVLSYCFKDQVWWGAI